MKYTQGRVGRIFVVKFEHHDVVIEKIAEFARREKIKAAAMVFIGALNAGTLAAGPKKPVVPPQPNRLSFRGGWETLGIGTIFTNKSGPQIHLHASMGKKRTVLTGCVREASNTFLVLETVVFELTGVKAGKEIDPETGLNLLRIG